MPKYNNSVYLHSISNIEDSPEVRDIADNLEDEINFKSLLKQYGLDDLRIEVLFYKYFLKANYLEIAQELGVPNTATVGYLLRSARELLRERGFKL